jgi:hypothetical protein
LAGGTARKKPSRAGPARASPKRPAARSVARPKSSPKRPVAPKSPPKKAAPAAPAPAKSAPPKKPIARPPAAKTPSGPPRGDGRIHVLSLSFVRDGDEFMARLETDAGQITELKNRSLDQLLTLVAGELEDLLE